MSTGKAETSQAEFLAADKTCKAISGAERGTFDGSEFLANVTLISVTWIPTAEVVENFTVPRTECTRQEEKSIKSDNNK